MTKEEIINAAIELVDYGTGQHNADSPIECFKKGAEFMDKHWQEKKRWKSLLDEPPKEPKPFEEVYLSLKHSDGGYAIKLSVSQNSVNYWLSEGFIAWKEIE